MLIIIKSSPTADDAKRGLQIAKDTNADVLLLQNAVYCLNRSMLDGISGSKYALEDDKRLRGISKSEEGVTLVGYDEAVDLMASADKVVGMF